MVAILSQPFASPAWTSEILAKKYFVKRIASRESELEFFAQHTFYGALLKRLCENCEVKSRYCDANVRFLSYPYIQTGFKDEQNGPLKCKGVRSR